MPGEKHNIKNFVDTSGELSNSGLSWATWLLERKLDFRKKIIITLIVFDVVLSCVAVYKWGKHFLFDIPAIQRNMYVLTLPPVRMHPKFAPQPIAVDTVRAYPAGKNQFTFTATARNQNKNWVAHISYVYSHSSGSTVEKTEVLLPGDNIQLSVLSESLQRSPSNIRFEQTNISWKRLNVHEFPNPLVTKENRLKIAVDDIAFTAANEAGGVHTIEFNLSNNSIYSYWDAEFDVVYLNGSKIVGVDRFSIPQFKTGKTEQVELKSLAPNLRVTGVQVIPRVDVFNKDVYITPGT